MKEKIIQFGPENNMIGIVSEPNNIDESRPAVLILNSGLIHRVGPSRMSVSLARSLAEQGFLVFRFDLPNIGDSLTYKTPLNYKERTVSEISIAMDTITKRYKIANFASLGLCTGAMNSHIIAVADERVKAAVMLDAYSYPTLKFLYKRYSGKWLKVCQPKTIMRIFSKLFAGKPHDDASKDEGEVYYWDMPPKKEIRKDLQLLVSRKVDLLYIYTGGLQCFYNYEEQFKDSFKSVDFNGCLDVYFLNKMDHTFMLQRDRNRMLSQLSLWLQGKFPAQ
jgi:pimeloyl-ACP methyl ester carboxylesterase